MKGSFLKTFVNSQANYYERTMLIKVRTFKIQGI